MPYRVVLTEKAESDIEGVLQWYRDQQATEAGGRWFAQLMDKIETLQSRPERCSLAAESEDTKTEIRELLLGKRRYKFRILFVMNDNTVSILRIWHSSRDVLLNEDIKE